MQTKRYFMSTGLLIGLAILGLCAAMAGSFRHPEPAMLGTRPAVVSQFTDEANPYSDNEVASRDKVETSLAVLPSPNATCNNCASDLECNTDPCCPGQPGFCGFAGGLHKRCICGE